MSSGWNATECMRVWTVWYTCLILRSILFVCSIICFCRHFIEFYWLLISISVLFVPHSVSHLFFHYFGVFFVRCVDMQHNHALQICFIHFVCMYIIHSLCILFYSYSFVPNRQYSMIHSTFNRHNSISFKSLYLLIFSEWI